MTIANIKPVITSAICGKRAFFTIDLQLRDNIVAITGDSAVGKSFLIDMLRGFSTDSLHLLVYDYTILHNLDVLKNTILTFKNIVFILDNADVLLTADIVDAIYAAGNVNQFILFGRSFRTILLSNYSYSELVVSEDKHTFSLRYPLVDN